MRTRCCLAGAAAAAANQGRPRGVGGLDVPQDQVFRHALVEEEADAVSAVVEGKQAPFPLSKAVERVALCVEGVWDWPIERSTVHDIRMSDQIINHRGHRPGGGQCVTGKAANRCSDTSGNNHNCSIAVS